MTLRSIQDHCDLSSDEGAALDKTMGPYDRLVEEAASSSVEGQSTQLSFASAMADASECDLLKALCSRCFSADELSKTRTKIATAKQQAEAVVEVEVEAEPEPELEVEVKAKIIEEPVATEPEVVQAEPKEVQEAVPVQEEPAVEEE